jgi:hypothetical protein
MKTSFHLVPHRLRYLAAVVFAFPILTGAEGDGCRPGGDVPVGSNDGGICSAEICRDLPRDLDARICPDGTALERSVCLPGADGRCGWEFPACPVVDAGPGQIDAMPPGLCDPEACRGMAATDDVKVCPDGTTQSRDVCTKAADGKCFWGFPLCPPIGGVPVCVQQDCAHKAATTEARICPDGTALGRTLCTPDARGDCWWDFPPCP